MKKKTRPPDPNPHTSKTFWIIISACFLFCITFISFWPSLFNDFVNCDDYEFIIGNPRVFNVSFENIRQIFLDRSLGQYFPLTLLSYNLNYFFFGLTPLSFHTVNLLIHILNVILVFWMIYLLSNKNLKIAFITAVIFGVHPLRVESVAWAAERKDVLFGFFYLSSLIAYIFYLDKTKKRRYYYLCLIFFLFSLLSKNMAVGLPLVLFIFDYFKKRPLGIKLFSEKIPFLFLSIVFCVITFLVHYAATEKEGNLPVMFYGTTWNLSDICHSLRSYVINFLYPANLCIYYIPHKDLSGIRYDWVLSAPWFLVAFLGLALYSARISRIIPFGIFFFLFSISPALFLWPWADRFTYIPLIGFAYLAAEAWHWLYLNFSKNKKSIKILLGIFLALTIGTLCLSTWSYCRNWKNDETLWANVIKKFPESAISYTFLSCYYLNQKNYNKAIEYSELATKYSFGMMPAAYETLGKIYAEMNKYEKSLHYYNRALEFSPDNPSASYNRGCLHLNFEKYREALSDFDLVIKKEPYKYLALNNRGVCHLMLGQLDQAILDFDKVLKINPKHVKAYINRGTAYLNKNKFDKAIEDFDQAIKYRPNSAEYFSNRAMAYFLKKDYDKSWQDIQKAKSLDLWVDPAFLNEVNKMRTKSGPTEA